MDARADARAEARLELGLELREVGVAQLVRERDEAREVVLARAARARRARRAAPRSQPRSPAARSTASAAGPPAPRSRFEQPARAVAREQRGALERDPRAVQHLFVVGRARIRPEQHRDLLERQPLGVQLADPLDDEGALRAGIVEPAQLRLGPVGAPRRAAASRRRRAAARAGSRARAPAASSGSSPRAGTPAPGRAQREQVLGGGAGEAVDRLVVVADDAEVVAVAEPVLEQRLLEQVHVLVLVDGERAVAGAELGDRAARRSRRAHRELEQVLEVDLARGRPCAPRRRRRPSTSGRRESAARGRRRRRGSRAAPIRRFLAHSISVARSPAGRKRYARGSPFAICRSSSAFDERIRPT